MSKGLILIIIGIILILLVLFSHKEIKKSDIYDYNDIKKHLKTGDIILFSIKSHKNLIENFKYFTRTKLVGSEYGHVGLIVRINDKIYVLECTDSGHTGDEFALHQNNGIGGIRMIDFDILSKEYIKKGATHYGIKFISQEIPLDVIKNNLKKYQNKTFENKAILTFLAIIDEGLSHEFATELSKNMCNKDKIMCSDFVHDILNESGVLKDYPSKIFWPQLFERPIFNNLQKIKYTDKVYKFIID